MKHTFHADKCTTDQFGISDVALKELDLPRQDRLLVTMYLRNQAVDGADLGALPKELLA